MTGKGRSLSRAAQEGRATNPPLKAQSFLCDALGYTFHRWTLIRGSPEPNRAGGKMPNVFVAVFGMASSWVEMPLTPALRTEDKRGNEGKFPLTLTLSPRRGNSRGWLLQIGRPEESPDGIRRFSRSAAGEERSAGERTAPCRLRGYTVLWPLWRRPGSAPRRPEAGRLTLANPCPIVSLCSPNSPICS